MKHGGNAERVKMDIQMIKDWLEKQPHMPKDLGKYHVLGGMCNFLPSTFGNGYVQVFAPEH